MRWFDGIINSTDKLWEIVKEREAWCGVAKSDLGAEKFRLSGR